MIKMIEKDQNGFTLVELMVSMVISTILLGALYGVFASISKSSTSNEVNVRMIQNFRTCFGFMESDIRMAGLDRFGSADAGIEVATSTALRFSADRNMDGVINTADLSDGLQELDLERITYIYDAPNRLLRQCLSEGTTNSWETMAEGVSGFSLHYFDGENNLLAFPIVDTALIREIEITISMERNAGIAGVASKTLTKRVLCRNLGI